MPTMTGKRAFLELLKQEGVDVLFGNPGTTELPLMDALAAEADIRYVLGLREAVVMGMADGYAQASGKLAVVNLHVAPASATPWACSTTPRRQPRRSWSPPASTSRAST